MAESQGDQREFPTPEELMEVAKHAVYQHLQMLAQAISGALTRVQIIEVLREAIDELEKEIE